MSIRDNLLPYNSSFNYGIDGWQSYISGNLSSELTDFYIGSGSLKVTKTSTSDNSGAYVVSSRRGIASANSVYSASAYVKVPTGQESVGIQLSIRYYDSTGTSISSTSSLSNTTVTSSDGWVRVKLENKTAPANTAFADVVVYQNSGTKTIGNYYLIDAVKLENSAISTQYIEERNQDQENKKVNLSLTPLPIPTVSGMQLNADIMLNDIVFNTIDENDVVWVCSDIQGWWELPDSEVPNLTRGLDDGSYDVRGRYTNRNLSFVGSILAPSPEAAVVARNRLIEAINLIHKGGWLLVNENPTKGAFVRISGKPEIANTKARGRIDFSIGLRAANPIKYKWNWEDVNGYVTKNVSNGGSNVLRNEGNIDVPILFTISANATSNLTAPIYVNNTSNSQILTIVKNLRAGNYSVNIANSERTSNIVTLTVASHAFLVGDRVSISNVTTSSPVDRTSLNEPNVTITSTTGTTITYTSVTGGTDLTSNVTNGKIGLSSADTLEVDTYNKSALLNGSANYARSYIDALVDWTTLKPGDNTITFSSVGGSGSNVLYIQYRSGWIG